MSKPHPILYLKHIRDELLFILTVTEQGLDKEEFLNDETLKRAVVRSLEIIGEASKKIPADFKAQWTNIKWKEMAGMRDRLIHGRNIILGNRIMDNITPTFF